MWLIICMTHIVLFLQHSKYFHLIISFHLHSNHCEWMLLTLMGISKKSTWKSINYSGLHSIFTSFMST